MAKPGSRLCARRNASLASSYSKRWSAASPCAKAVRASAETDSGKFAAVWPLRAIGDAASHDKHARNKSRGAHLLASPATAEGGELRCLRIHDVGDVSGAADSEVLVLRK